MEILKVIKTTNHPTYQIRYNNDTYLFESFGSLRWFIFTGYNSIKRLTDYYLIDKLLIEFEIALKFYQRVQKLKRIISGDNKSKKLERTSK